MRYVELKEEKLPSVKTYDPDYIAKKHNVPVKKILDQLKAGIKVEYEHAQDKKTAREIALDHLLEFPDYYDRLDSMEKTAAAEEE